MSIIQDAVDGANGFEGLAMEYNTAYDNKAIVFAILSVRQRLAVINLQLQELFVRLGKLEKE